MPSLFWACREGAFDDMKVNDWQALEGRYKFKFPSDFFLLYEELERTRVISDWEADGLGRYLQLATPEQAEQWWNRRVDPDLLPIIHVASGDFICLRLPYKIDDPLMWVQCEYETNYRASLGRSFAGVIRVLAAYLDAWSFECSAKGEPEEGEALFRRSRRLIAEIGGLFDDNERDKLRGLRMWPLGIGRSPVTSCLSVVIPSFDFIDAAHGILTRSLGLPEYQLNAIVAEDNFFGAGHWALGVIYALQGRIPETCREWALVMEEDLRTSQPLIDMVYMDVYAAPPRANFGITANFLRAHKAEYLSVSRNRAVRSIILGDGFDKMGSWLAGLTDCMRNGWHDEARPIAQSLLGSYLSDEWFSDACEVDAFDACCDALASIYTAVGLECRVRGPEK